MTNKTGNKKYIVTFFQMAFYILVSIIRKDLDNDNTDILQLAYMQLKLWEDKRILEKAEYMESSDDIPGNIYEFIIDIIRDEIIENENEQFLSFIMEYLISRFSFTKEDYNKYNNDPELLEQYVTNGSEKNDSIEKCCKLLYIYLYSGSTLNKQTILVHYAEGLCSSLENKCKTNMAAKLCQTLGIKDLGSDCSYQKFLSRQREVVTDFLGIEYRMLEKFIIDSIGLDSDHKPEKDKDLRLLCVEYTLMDIHQEHALSSGRIVGLNEKEYSDIINRIFESMCNARLYIEYRNLCEVGHKPASLKEFAENTVIENPQTFITSLFISFRYELLAERLKKCLNEFYKSFLEAEAREEKLYSQNACLQSKIEKLQQKLEQQEAAHRQTIQKMSKAGEKEIHEYMKQIRYLEKKLEALQKSNCSLGKSLADMARMTGEETPRGKNKKPADMSRLSSLKILFLGGSPSTVKKLKKTFPNASFIDKKSSLIPDNVDLIVVLTNHIGHSLTQKLEASNSMAKIINCNCTNIDLITQQILEAI